MQLIHHRQPCWDWAGLRGRAVRSLSDLWRALDWFLRGARLPTRTVPPLRGTVADHSQRPASDRFGAGLLDLIAATIRDADRYGLLLESTMHIDAEPPLPCRDVLLGIADAILRDIVVQSWVGSSRGRIDVSVQVSARRVKLVIEDDGWCSRSHTTWQTHNRTACAMATQAGGELRWEVDWAVNRTVCLLPNAEAAPRQH